MQTRICTCNYDIFRLIEYKIPTYSVQTVILFIGLKMEKMCMVLEAKARLSKMILYPAYRPTLSN